MRLDFSRLSRTSLFRAVARVLVFLLLTQNFPAPAFRSQAHAAVGVLWVDAGGVCAGNTPCFTKIQAAIDAVTAGQTVRVLAGEYLERLVVTGKNATATATESDRIVIEADPAAAVGTVLLRGPRDRCQRGFAVTFKRSSFVTLRGFRIEGAGRRGIALRGGGSQGEGIHLERNRLQGGNPRECLGGIEIGRGNPDTVIANNVIAGVRRQCAPVQLPLRPRVRHRQHHHPERGQRPLHRARRRDVGLEQHRRPERLPEKRQADA